MTIVIDTGSEWVKCIIRAFKMYFFYLELSGDCSFPY